MDTLEGVGISFSGLSTVEISPAAVIAALDAQAAAPTRPSHAGCAGCLHYDNNPYLQCAVHPLERPGEVCGDWEDGATAEAEGWRMDAALTIRNAELEAQETLTMRNQREYAAENAWFIEEQRENGAGAWGGG